MECLNYPQSPYKFMNIGINVIYAGISNIYQYLVIIVIIAQSINLLHYMIANLPLHYQNLDAHQSWQVVHLYNDL